nr:hypothetical protein [Tanacetum cinerariifolium]
MQNNQEEVCECAQDTDGSGYRNKGPSMDILKNQKNVLDAYMIERFQDLKPWEEVIPPKPKAINVKHKVNTAGTKDKVESVDKQCDLGDKCWSDQDGGFFTYIGLPNRTSNKDSVNDLVDAFDDLVDANTKLEEVDKDLS